MQQAQVANSKWFCWWRSAYILRLGQCPISVPIATGNPTEEDLAYETYMSRGVMRAEVGAADAFSLSNIPLVNFFSNFCNADSSPIDYRFITKLI